MPTETDFSEINSALQMPPGLPFDTFIPPISDANQKIAFKDWAKIIKSIKYTASYLQLP